MRINIRKKPSGEPIGETTHCVKCSGSCFDSSGKERPATLPFGYVVNKAGEKIKATFCSGWCLSEMVQNNPDWNGKTQWKPEYGLKKLP